MHYHLTQLHFLQMIFLAFMLHFAGLLIYSFMPHESTISVPVRALNIKLGNTEETASRTAQEPEQAAAQPASTALSTVVVEERQEIEQPAEERDVGAVLDAMDTAFKNIEEHPSDFEIADREAKEKAKKRAVSSTLGNAVPTEYSRRTQQQSGSSYGNTTDNDAEARITSYGQLVGAWLRRNQYYPQEYKNYGLTGTAVVRIQIDRSGRILNYRMAKSTGSKHLDYAVNVTINNSNPVPRIPSDVYRGARVVEMEAQLTFKLQ